MYCAATPYTACNTCTSLSYIFSTTAHALNRPRSVWSIARSSSSVAATQPSPAPPTLECSTNGKKLKVIGHIQLSIYHYFKYKVREACMDTSNGKHQMQQIQSEGESGFKFPCTHINLCYILIVHTCTSLKSKLTSIIGLSLCTQSITFHWLFSNYPAEDRAKFHTCPTYCSLLYMIGGKQGCH